MAGKGQFIISIDYEFALGLADHSLSESDKAIIRDEIGITERLVRLFEKYRIPATWAVTGHLLEESCTWDGAMVHPEYQRPIRKGERRDWFAQHPPRGRHDDPLWFDTHTLIQRIADSSAGHEIASHSYAHIIYGDKEVSRQAVESDLDNMMRVHKNRALPISSFVFPRNSEGHYALLKQHGIHYYRGALDHWYDYLPGILKRAGHLFDYLLPLVRTGEARVGKEGMVDVPASMLLLGRGGLRKVIPPWFMEWKIKKGLKKASAEGRMFHLWFHPSNFWHDREKQFSIFENILKEAWRLRERDELEIVTMREAGNRILNP